MIRRRQPSAKGLVHIPSSLHTDPLRKSLSHFIVSLQRTEECIEIGTRERNSAAKSGESSEVIDVYLWAFLRKSGGWTELVERPVVFKSRDLYHVSFGQQGETLPETELPFFGCIRVFECDKFSIFVDQRLMMTIRWNGRKEQDRYDLHVDCPRDKGFPSKYSVLSYIIL